MLLLRMAPMQFRVWVLGKLISLVADVAEQLQDDLWARRLRGVPNPTTQADIDEATARLAGAYDAWYPV